MDPASGLDARRDIAIGGGRISAVEPHIPLGDAADAIDATDLLVVPGLVDLHVHVYWGVADLSVRAGPSDLARGVTTTVDAGSAGANTLPGFKEYVIEPFDGRILVFVNISAMGQIDPFLGELHDERYLIAERVADAVRANPETVVGIKVRLTESLTGPNAITALDRAIEAGEAADVPVMVHIGDSTATTDETLSRLRAGDIVTHAFTDRRNGIFDEAGCTTRRSMLGDAASASTSDTAPVRSPSLAPKPPLRRASGQTPSAPTCTASMSRGLSMTS
jgi:dihydroorotase